ncbi:hypothetical protein J2W35_005585 [Variovorax boronicumulans]|nr:hypothetical protein [Variovorax boronicumulans]
MTMNLLKEIAASRLPISFHRADDIEQVRFLRDAGLVVALVPAPADPLALARRGHAAQVLAITQKRRELLAQFNMPSASPLRWRQQMPRLSARSFASMRKAAAPQPRQSGRVQ